MAVAPVKSIGIIGLMSDLDKVIRVCGDSQIFHPDEASNFYSDTKILYRLRTETHTATFLQTLTKFWIWPASGRRLST